MVGVRSVEARLEFAGSGSGDERGATLQTLIITAVLVLLAVAAGVVIVAITGNSADDLEGQASDLAGGGSCQPWEIHDPQLAAAGVGGGEETSLKWDNNPGSVMFVEADWGRPGQGGVTSSRIGCLAPCYLGVTGNNPPHPDLASLSFLRRLSDSREYLDEFLKPNLMNNFYGGATPPTVEEFPVRLVFDTSNRPPMPDNSEVFLEYRVGVTHLLSRTESPEVRVDNWNKHPGYDSGAPRYGGGYKRLPYREKPANLRVIGTNSPPVAPGSKLALKVTAGQDGCIIFNTDTDAICVDSKRPIGNQDTGLC